MQETCIYGIHQFKGYDMNYLDELHKYKDKIRAPNHHNSIFSF